MNYVYYFEEMLIFSFIASCYHARVVFHVCVCGGSGAQRGGDPIGYQLDANLSFGLGPD